MTKYFKGKKDAPVGIIPGVGESGPDVGIQARSDAHAEAIEATGFYEVAKAPPAPEPPAEDQLIEDKPAEKPAATDDKKKAGK